MSAATKIAAFAAALAVVFAAAFGVGAVFGPAGAPPGHAEHAESAGPSGDFVPVGGESVTLGADLQPYLGAYGHLVALRATPAGPATAEFTVRAR